MNPQEQPEQQEQTQTQPVLYDPIKARHAERTKGRVKKVVKSAQKKGKKKRDPALKASGTYKLRLLLLKEEREKIDLNLHGVTFVYNNGLKRLRKYCKDRTVGRFHETEYIPDLKDEYPWLRDGIIAEAVKNTLTHLNCTWDNSFGKSGEKGRCKPGTLDFRKRNTFRLNNGVEIEDGLLYLPRFSKGIRFKGKAPNLPIAACTIEKTEDGIYYAHIHVKGVRDETPEPEYFAVGMDVGISPLIATSDGRKVANPKKETEVNEQWKPTANIRDRKEKGSRRYEKMNKRVQKVKKHGVTSQKHELKRIAKRELYRVQVVFMETLNIRWILENNYGAYEAKLRELNGNLEHKAARSGRQIVRCHRTFASSKTCSVCGCKNSKLPKYAKEWTCPFCGAELERDPNAGINLLFEGLKQIATPALIERHREVPMHLVPMREVIPLGKSQAGQIVWGLAANGLEAEVAAAMKVGLLFCPDPEHVSIAA